MKDPRDLEEADKLKLEIDPLNGDEVASLVNEVSRTPAEVVTRVRAALENK